MHRIIVTFPYHVLNCIFIASQGNEKKREPREKTRDLSQKAKFTIRTTSKQTTTVESKMGYTLAIVGCGVMGQALLSAIYNAPTAETQELESLYPSKIITCNHDARSAAAVDDLLKTFGVSPHGITVTSTYEKNVASVEQADVIILATKPFLVKAVLDQVKDAIKDKLVISLATGWTFELFSHYTKYVSRVMTNTPAKFGFGCAVVCNSDAVTEHQRMLVSQLISHVGTVVELPEKNMDAATALVGSGPAFVLLMLEAMMESGIKMGIPLRESRECAMKVLEGTAKMLEKTGDHPSVLKHQICTPGGTTIAGLFTMEELGLKSAIVKGVVEAANVSAEITSKMYKDLQSDN